nr:MAG TPA: GFD1 mRNA transport factor [Caudoviricetes sp.]
MRKYTKIALTIAVTVITTKLVLHIEEQRKIRALHNRIAKLVQID